MSEPHGDATHPEHAHPDRAHDDEFSLEMPHEHGGGEAEHPLDALGLSASSEEFHFSGPAEDLDFTEPTDFTFPAGPAAEGEAESSADLSSLEHAGVEHAGVEHLLGGEDAEAVQAAPGEELLAEGEATVADLDLGDEAAVEKPKRQLPAWVFTLQWVLVGLLGAGSLIALIVGVGWIQNPETVTTILDIACPVMLLLIPFALWRSSEHWLKPATSALYTVMLAICVAALIGGTWTLGREVASFNWHFNKARVAADKPRAKYTPLPPPAPSTNDAK